MDLGLWNEGLVIRIRRGRSRKNFVSQAVAHPVSPVRVNVKLWAVAVGAVVCGQFAAISLLPRGFLLTLLSDSINLVLILSALFVFAANARASEPEIKPFWALVSAGWGITLFGQLLWMYFDIVLRQEVPNPFVGDVLLFLSNVPVLAALLLQPNLRSPNAVRQQRYLDFILLLLWWLYLYLFCVIPWQYVNLNEARYGANYNSLALLFEVVLLLTLAFSWANSSGGWRWVFGTLFAAQLANALTAQWINRAIDRHTYYPGSPYDGPYAMALGLYTVVGLVGLSVRCASDLPKTKAAVLPFASFGMAAVLSIPAFGAWASLRYQGSPAVMRFRELVTFGTVSIMALLVFAKKGQLDRQLARTNRVLQTASMTDFLTGVRNRRFFDAVIPGEASHVIRSYQSGDAKSADLILYMADLDDFKEINDRYGHDMGDKILVEVARRIASLIRGSDVLVRWGGDEFLVASRNSNRADGAGFALRLLTALAKPMEADGIQITLNISIGWAAYPWYQDDPAAVPLETVLALSDRALYEAKEGGKNRAVGVSPHKDGKVLVIGTQEVRVSAYSVETQQLQGPLSPAETPIAR